MSTMVVHSVPPIPRIAPDPSPSLANDGNLSDTGSNGYLSATDVNSSRRARGTPKFPHLRARLAVIAREHKQLSANRDSSGAESDVDADGDGLVGGPVSAMLVKNVAELLDQEKEEDLKILLKSNFDMDDDAIESQVLELMHAHKDDTAGVPFLFLTPTRRPISRPSSRASTHSFRVAPGPPRPDTPQSVVSTPGSPSLLGPIRRPHTPAMSPLASGQSPSTSPVLSHTHPHVAVSHQSFLATSLPASPLSSPRLLNAKASEFRPTRPHSSASTNLPSLVGRRAETPSPDLWAHGGGALRSASKLAIASPLIPDSTLLPPGTPPRAHTPTSPLRIASTHEDDENEEDPFDPFAAREKTRAFHSIQPTANHTDFETGLSNSSNSNSSLSEENGGLWGAHGFMGPHFPEGYFDAEGPTDLHTHGLMHHGYNHLSGAYFFDQQNAAVNETEIDPEMAATLTDGMTPFDVLASVFGSSLAPSELEEALAVNGYEFERAMQWLVDRANPNPPSQQQRGIQTHAFGGGVHVVPRSQAGLVIRGGRVAVGGGIGRGRFVNGRPAPNGNRVCRYFLAGECMRADCRFSHDLDRALCRFWLRGACAKGESCEFLHNLPKEVDVNSLSNTMGHMDLNDNGHRANNGLDEFPTLSHDSLHARGRGGYLGLNGRSYDPSRSRFASVVKKAAPSQQMAVAANSTFIGPPSGGLAAQMAGRREAKAVVGDSVFSRPTVVAPRPSTRIKLRQPSLLPTLPTGESVNQLYMNYRQRALQLGAARNACLSRAADAWRRGDGAAAKRFSREGHDLNAKMSAEAAEAAGKLVRERAKLAEQAVRNRDASWSDDPGDRTSRGKMIGAGLGVCLGIASKSVEEGTAKLSQEERMEVALDVHGLHSNEATEVLEEFLLALEKEHFFGLAYIVVGEEKHTGTQDPARGASRARLATGIREWLHNWGYPWSERDGIIWVDPLTHSN